MKSTQRTWIGQVAGMLAVLAVLTAMCVAIPAAFANPIQDGSVVDFKSANDLGKTFDFYIRTYGVQILGTVVGIGGATQLGSRPAVAAGGLTGGVVMLFWPSIMGSGQSQVQAAAGTIVAWTPRLLMQGGQLVLEGALGMLAWMTYRTRRRAVGVA